MFSCSLYSVFRWLISISSLEDEEVVTQDLALLKLITLAVIKKLCASIDAEAGRTPFLKKKKLSAK
jgi:hypothetical protein